MSAVRGALMFDERDLGRAARLRRAGASFVKARRARSGGRCESADACSVRRRQYVAGSLFPAGAGAGRQSQCHRATSRRSRLLSRRSSIRSRSSVASRAGDAGCLDDGPAGVRSAEPGPRRCRLGGTLPAAPGGRLGDGRTDHGSALRGGGLLRWPRRTRNRRVWSTSTVGRRCPTTTLHRLSRFPPTRMLTVRTSKRHVPSRRQQGSISTGLGDPYAGRSDAPSGQDTEGLRQNDCGQGLIAGKPVNGVWPPEQQTVTDPTGTGGLVTPRTAAWVAKARASLGALSITCWDAHLWNPTSDHPKGLACDVMVGADSRKSPSAKAQGDRIANWAIQTAGQTGCTT